MKSLLTEWVHTNYKSLWAGTSDFTTSPSEDIIHQVMSCILLRLCYDIKKSLSHKLTAEMKDTRDFIRCTQTLDSFKFNASNNGWKKKSSKWTYFIAADSSDDWQCWRILINGIRVVQNIHSIVWYWLRPAAMFNHDVC